MPRKANKRHITRMTFGEIAYKLGLNPKQKLVIRRLLLAKGQLERK